MIDMIRIARDRLLLLYPASSSGWTAAPYKEDLELTIENIRCYFGKDISFGVGDVCLRLSDLSEGYKKACTRYDDARFLDKCGFVAQGSMTIEPQALPTLNVDEAQAIASLLQSGEAVHLTQALHALFSRLENEGRYASELTFIYAELIHILLRVARSFDFAMPCDGIPPLDDFKRISDLREWFCTEFLDVHTAVRAREGRHYGDYTRAAIRYMRKNYGRKISLRDIAAELNLNASYLSRLFKEETGENLISWLNDLRLDEAERLLQAHELTIREIADRVGILNYNHFFTMFRESRGLTPSQYRKKLVESQEKF